MLKEVGSSGQISLGKKYAGQLFEVTTEADGSISMRPVKVVPMTQEERAPYAVSPSPAAGDGYFTPERLARRAAAAARTPAEIEAAGAKWEEENKEAIVAFNKRVKKVGSMARRIHEWRESQVLKAVTQNGGT